MQRRRDPILRINIGMVNSDIVQYLYSQGITKGTSDRGIYVVSNFQHTSQMEAINVVWTGPNDLVSNLRHLALGFASILYLAVHFFFGPHSKTIIASLYSIQVFKMQTRQNKWRNNKMEVTGQWHIYYHEGDGGTKQGIKTPKRVISSNKIIYVEY